MFCRYADGVVRLEVLLTGNTAYVTEAFIKTAFPDDHVLVTKNTDSSSYIDVAASRAAAALLYP